MTSENTLKADLGKVRARLAEAEKQNRELRETIDQVHREMERAAVPNRLPEPGGQTRVLTTSERVRFMAIRFGMLFQKNQALQAQLEEQRSTAGQLVGPDGRPLTH